MCESSDFFSSYRQNFLARADKKIAPRKASVLSGGRGNMHARGLITYMHVNLHVTDCRVVLHFRNVLSEGQHQ